MNILKAFLICLVSALLIALPTGCKKTATNVIEKGTVKDYEGNSYPTVKIGSQWWMAKNLKATKYNNGEQIGTTTPYSLSITGATSPEYHWAYQGSESIAAIYGRQYTWYAATDSRNVCPAGWHVPSDTEWSVLTDYLAANGYGYQTSSNAISKSLAATSGWLMYAITGVPGNDQVSNNRTGFGAMPGGLRLANGTYQNAGETAYYWSSTADIPALASYRLISFDINSVQVGNLPKESGMSVRCVKD